MRVLKQLRRSITLLLVVAILHHVSTLSTLGQEKGVDLTARAGRLRRGVNLRHWFSQAANYSKTHLDTHTTAQDIALIKSMGFDHVRFPIEPAPLLPAPLLEATPSILNPTYLQYIDTALDMMLANGLAVVVDIHPSDEFKIKMLRDDRNVETFAQFWRAFAAHLSKRD